MTNFLRNGKMFRPNDETAMWVEDQLPAANYVINRDQQGNFFLEMVEKFPNPSKFYGSTIKHTKRILNTFLDRDGSTGILLAGEKGSGKTLLAKMLSIAGAETGIPTIVINAPWVGDKFNAFMQTIEQPCMVLFDEFEKVYDSQDQEQALTLLDGVFPSKKLFVLTCNDKWRIDSHMRNRPGRIFYMVNFVGLDEAFIREYCADNLNDKSHTDKIANIASVFSAFNFDMLKALVEEMNRYNESPQEALRILNVKAEFDSGATYSVEIYRGDRKADRVSPTHWTGTPLSTKDICISYFLKSLKKAEPEELKLAPSSNSLVGADDDEESEEFHIPRHWMESISTRLVNIFFYKNLLGLV